TTGLAMSMLNVPLPRKTLTIEDLFPGETVVFPLGALNEADGRQLESCFPAKAAESVTNPRSLRHEKSPGRETGAFRQRRFSSIRTDSRGTGCRLRGGTGLPAP